MRLVRQVTLEFQEGTSDKVYEVDLCELGTDRFVVNFRYGRRGTILRDGTKTPASVNEADAGRLFDDLVASKENKGYRRAGSTTAVSAESSPPAESAPDRLQAREKAVMQRLAEGHSKVSRWSLSRAVWRSGELQLFQAEPFLIGLISSGDAMLDYCIAWALGQCGSDTSIDPLRRLKGSHKETFVRRIAGFALLEVLEGDEYEEAIRTCMEQLPESIRELVESGPTTDFVVKLNRLLEETGRDANCILEVLYLIDHDQVRPALLELFTTIGLEPGRFDQIRHIFKAAELRRDGEVFGILARRFEKTPPRFRMQGRWHYPKRQLPTTGEDPSEAFSQQTRRYLRQRVWRTLQRIAELNQSHDYANLAAGVLLAFSDDDASPVRREERYKWDARARRGDVEIIHFDQYANHFALNRILYGNSRRYQRDSSKLVFRCVPPFEPGNEWAPEREEAYPELWDQHSKTVLHLLFRSRCAVVHVFGVNVLRAANDFCQQLGVESLVKLLQSTYETTVRFSFDLATARYDAAAPDRMLVLALANCTYQPARVQAFGWIDADRAGFLLDGDFAVALVTGPQPETRAFARDRLRNVSLPEQTAQAIVGRLMSVLHGLNTESGPVAADIVETLLLVFGHHLRQVGEEIIRDLLSHVLPEVQRFAGDLVLGHETFFRHPPDDVLHALLESDHEAVRGIGVQIIRQLPDGVLLNSMELLLGLTRHQRPDIRSAIRPTVLRLSTADREFGERIARLLIEALLTPGAADGVPTHTALILREDLRDCLTHIEPDIVWSLLQSRSAPAQEVGGVLLSTNVNSAHLSVDKIVQLTGHEILSVRESAWKMCHDNVVRLQVEPESTVRMTDSRWEDTRQFAFAFLQEYLLQDGAFSPDVLISICDSVRADVQQFGRSLVTRLFNDGHGEEYVVKLSEHPAEAMQLFASGFLEQHASDNPEQLQQLAPYFISVLSRVNRGRVAKSRTLQLLEREAMKDEQAAGVAADILSRISATAAIADRAAAVQLLLEIQRTWPAIDTPLVVKTVEVRGGV
ncbi:MAG: WGR domain-containing protein [Planctomycetaceae bacterium]